MGGILASTSRSNAELIKQGEKMMSRPLPRNFLDLVNRHGKRSQPNIDLPLEVNLGTDAVLKVIKVGAKLDRELKDQLIAMLNKYNMFLLVLILTCGGLIPTSWFTDYPCNLGISLSNRN